MVVLQQQLRSIATAIFIAGCAYDHFGAAGAVHVDTHVDEWRDQVIYQLMVDRFANGDARNDWRVDPSALARYQGGDWQGVIDHLDYLDTLGVTALWISPIILNIDTDSGIDGYHGYWAVDLTALNPHFGDLVTLRTLVNAAHARGMLVILDIVTNHMGQVFYYDINMNGRPDDNLYGSGTVPPGGDGSQMSSPFSHVSEYDPDFDPNGIQSFTSLGLAGPAPIRFFDMPEIFREPPMPLLFQDATAYSRRGRTLNFADPQQLLWGDFPGGLKDINTLDPRVREQMVDSYVHWVLETDLDGFRIDTVKHVDYGFWEYFAPQVRQRLADAGKNKFFMFGEAFDDHDDLIGSFTLPGRLDSAFYFSQRGILEGIFGNGNATSGLQALFAQRSANYGQTPQENGVGVAPASVLVNFLDNHDVSRFLHVRNDDRGRQALHAALAYLLTEDGIPCIYYGTEQEFFGGNDPSNREPLWASGYARDGDTFQWIARLTHIRRHYSALTRGNFALQWVTDRTGAEEDAGIVAFERVDGAHYALVVINAQGNHMSHTAFGTSTMAVTAPAGSTLIDALSADRLTVGADGHMTVDVGPYAARILVPEADYDPSL